jgi:hypothetical protein
MQPKMDNLLTLPAKLASSLNRHSRLAGISSQTRRRILTGAVLFAVFFTYLAVVQFSTPDMPDNDGYYHIKLAYLMRTEGLRPAFPWLPLTILNPREFYDHHFLFHVALIPFTFGDLRMGAKWAAMLFSSVAFLIIWRFLDRQRVPYAALWSIGLLAVSEAFIYRMSITRAQSLSLGVLVMGLDLLFTRKYKWLVPLAFVYVWMYDAFPLLLLVAGLYTLAVWLIERRLDLRPLLFTAAGISLGLLINPYFPYNIIFNLRHLIPKLTETTATNVGNEWYPYTTGQILKNSPLALATFLLGALALGMVGKRMDTRTATTFFVAILFGFMLFQARRFIEYFPPFALIFAALACAPLLVQTEEPGVRQENQSERQIPTRSWSTVSRRQWIAGGLMVLVLVPGMLYTGHASQSSIRTSQPYGLYAQASAWLQANTPPGSRVFQTDWDDFPRLFFYNSKNTYLVGLDPTYMQLYDPQLYDLWVKITNGSVAQPSLYIYPRFGAEYVVTDLNHTDFIHRADADPGLVQVFHDSQSVIYQVIKH